jgi:hypothetical protein
LHAEPGLSVGCSSGEELAQFIRTPTRGFGPEVYGQRKLACRKKLPKLAALSEDV